MTTRDEWYTLRLLSIRRNAWKRFLRPVNPYRILLQRVVGDDKTLEVGCGIGRVLDWLPNGIGVDHNESSVNFCRAKGLEAYTVSDFESKTDRFTLAFECLTFVHFFEHIKSESQFEVLNHYLSYLKPGGKVLVICPMERGFDSDETHVAFMDFYDIRTLMFSAGLLEIKSFSFPFPRHAGRFFIYNEFICIFQKEGYQ